MTVINNDARDQYSATGGQTIFNYTFEISDQDNIQVYQRASSAAPDDAADILTLGVDYTVTGVGVNTGGTIVLTSGATAGDIVTLQGNAPPVRSTSFVAGGTIQAANLNTEFDDEILIYQTLLARMNFLIPAYPKSAVVNDFDLVLPILGAEQTWVMNAAGTEIVAADFPADGAANKLDTYVTLTDETANEPNSFPLSAIGDGLMINVTGTTSILTRSLAGTANQINIADPTGVGGNPTFSIADNVILPGTAGMGIPQGTTAQRVNPVTGIGLRYNTTLAALEYYAGGTWIQLDDADLSLYLLLAGGTMSGNISMGGVAKVTDALDPSDPQDYATKNYVDGGGGSPPFLPLAGGTMAGDIDFDNLYTGINVKDPVNPQDIATKNYVDQTALTGTSVYAATTATLNATQAGAGVGATLTDASGTFAAFTTDGQSPSVGDLILNKDQAVAANQGIYELTTNGDGISVPWVLTRATTYNTPSEINKTGLITVRNGTTLGGTQWYNTSTIVTVDTTAFSYSEFGAAFVESVTGTANEIDVDNSDPKNPVLSLSSTLVAPGTVTVGNLFFTGDEIQHLADTNNKIVFGTDTQDFQTGGSSRLDLSDAGMRLGGANARVTTTLDEDNMVSDSATALATQQSIKAYVDNTIAAQFPALGRVTLTSGVPVTSGDVTAATTIYYTPYKGNKLALYDGAKWVNYAFAELSLAVPAVANQMYDIFIYANVGVPTIELTAWTDDTNRATALTTQDGVYVKTGALTRRYVGSFRTTAVAGQTEDSNSNRLLYNYYNRVQRALSASDNTNSWTYSSSTFQQANASANNQVNFVIGISEDMVAAKVVSCAQGNNLASGGIVGVGYDSTTVNSAHSNFAAMQTASAGTGTCVAYYVDNTPGIGYHFMAWIEANYSNANVLTWFGDNNLTGVLSGISGYIFA